MLIETTAKLIYDPIRKDLKKTHKSRCLIAELKTDDLFALYRSFIAKKYGEKFCPQAPVFKPHVTVIGPYEKIDLNKWKTKPHNGKIVKISYSVDVEKHWKFWVLPVQSEDLVNIRKEFNLDKNSWNFHITVGRDLDWQN